MTTQTTGEKILFSCLGVVGGFFVGALLGLLIAFVGGCTIAFVFTPNNPDSILSIAFEFVPKICAVLGVLISGLCPWVEE